MIKRTPSTLRFAALALGLACAGPTLTADLTVVSFGGANKAFATQCIIESFVRILREELVDLRDAGCDFIQFDEPVLTEVVMSEECDRRTFM